ncbi:alpha/beta fold hydrolase [uncultured Roseovarius sp.]|uniref:alpha/beta fold hydrolase n=1 Tax=uncultured Roseovarius sp. TaxID=293344 RepID=UPI002601E7F2|nr:alpha/beta fold hydrolase [uncultured Roseovarius sp.]
MPLIHVDAGTDAPELHDLPGTLGEMLPDLLVGKGPVILMIHGFKYAPGHAHECPHRHILSLSPERECFKVISWPAGLGFGQETRDEGLGISFGWHARGTLWQAYAEAARAGERLAQLVTLIRRLAPARPIHAVAHSLGARVVLSALPHLQAGTLGRLILLAGAEFGRRAAEALETPAGRSAEVINVTSRENDFYDFLLECLIPAPARGDRSLGLALPKGPNVLNLQMDHPGTLRALRRAGFEVANPTARICHWSPYTRPGVFPMYQKLLRNTEQLPLAQLRAALPDRPAPRWSRLMSLPEMRLPLPSGRKLSS